MLSLTELEHSQESEQGAACLIQSISGLQCTPLSLLCAASYVVGSVLTWRFLVGLLQLSDLTCCGGYKKFTFILECLRPGIT